ncbi:MAG: hypothetical protein L0H23_09750, partial [Luteimonas sp.]|nr:hypothetical protein [Luteimonas sp.]
MAALRRWCGVDRIFPQAGQSWRACSGTIRASRPPVRSMQPIISIERLGKTYASGFQALKSIDLEI